MKRFIAIALICTLLICLCPLTLADSNDATVRVRLSVGDVTTFSVSLSGEFTVGSTSLSGGTIEASLTDGLVTLRHSEEGKLASGKSVTVKRPTSATSESFIALKNSKHGDCRYLGDMEFRAEDGLLRVINHVHIHEYLYGAVSGEVSESSNVELLKTQTIAAKGFALAEVQARTGSYYDVVDTTTSQIYIGYVKEDVRTIAAVDEVWQNTLLYQGNIVKTYYCTANGGQIITPRMRWGGTVNDGAYGFGYDPFDLAGSSKNVVIEIDGANPKAMPEALYSYMLKLADKAVSGTAEKLVSINSAQGYYDKDNREGTARYPIDLAPQELIELQVTVAREGKSDSDCILAFSPQELIDAGAVTATGSVRFIASTGEGRWVLVYGISSGHRAGMSHRGATRMAKLGYSYVDILSFYYSGAVLTSPNGSTASPSLPTISPTPTPAGEYSGYGYINADEVNIRTGPSSDYPTLGELNYGETLGVYHLDGSWYYVQVIGDGRTGYVYSRYVTLGTPPTAAPTPTAVPTPTPTERPKPTVNPSLHPAMKGDADGSGAVTAADAALVLRYIVELDVLNPEQLTAADADEDSFVTAKDASRILRYLVGLVDTL